MTDVRVPEDRPVFATYMEITNPSAFRPSFADDPVITVVEAESVSVAEYRHLYSSVGAGFSWVDRLKWSDVELREYLDRDDVTILVLKVSGVTAGYAEILVRSDEPGTELKYFGIFPEFHGRGFGKHLLSVAVQRAFNDGANRIWLSTRSTDGAHAIANYVTRGFKTYKTEWEPAPVHPDAGSA